MAGEATSQEILSPGLALRLLGCLLLGAVLITALLMLLPNREYYRWQQGDGTILFRARPIYERIHFDAPPIDVAMIGSSRMEASARAPELSIRLSAMLGHPVTVENFGLPQEGRDLSWAVAQQLLETRNDVKLIVLSLGPEAVLSHPGFRFLGDDASIAGAPVIYNPDYFENLLTLPYRHLAYFIQGSWPWAFQLSPSFDPAIYKARRFDPARSFHMPYGTLIDRDKKLGAEAASIPEQTIPPGVAFDGKLRYLSLDQRYANERHFMRLIAQLAKKKHVTVAFLRVPVYHGRQEIYDDPGFYEAIGPVFAPSFLGDDPNDYMDSAHLNRTGTGKLTPWLTDQIAPVLSKADTEKR